MTTHKTLTLACDGSERCTSLFTGPTYKAATYGSSSAARNLRRDAARAGWSRNPEVGDLCPTHTAKARLDRAKARAQR